MNPGTAPEAAQTDQTPDAGPERAIGPAALMVVGLMGLGIVATLAREMLLARGFGTGHEIELFRLAFAIPNLLATSLGTVIVAALAPHVLAERSDRGAQVRALQTSIAASALVGIVLGLVGAVSAPWQAALMAPGYSPDARSELVPVIAALWIFFALISATFGPRAFLGARGVVWPMASSSLVLSGTMAIGIVGLLALPADARTALALSSIAIGAAAILILVHFVALPRKLVRDAVRPPFRIAARSYLSFGVTTLVVLSGHLLNAVPRLVDRAAATGFESGAVAAMDFSFAILTVPGVVFGTAIATVSLPRFLAGIRRNDRAVLRKLGVLALASTALATLVGVLLSMSAGPIVELLFARGAFDARAIVLTAGILKWHGLALGPMIAAIILSQALLSIGYLRIFLLVAASRVAAKVVAVEYMTRGAGLDGLAASFLIPEILSTILYFVVVVYWYRSRMLKAGS